MTGEVRDGKWPKYALKGRTVLPATYMSWDRQAVISITDFEAWIYQAPN